MRQTRLLVHFALLIIASTAMASETKSGGSGGAVEASGGLEMKTEPGTAATKNSDTVTWKGCEGNFKAQVVDEHGKGTDSKGGQDCGEIKQMDKGLATAFAKAIPYCMRKGEGSVTIKNIKADVMGCFADRNKNVPGGGSTEKSEHAEGRAMDLKGLHVEYSDGSKTDFNFNVKEGEKTPPEDVEKLRKCWSDAVHGLDSRAAEAMGIGAAEKLCGGGGGAAQSGGDSGKVSGTIWSDKVATSPPKNALHDNHLHIECLSKDGK